jgi:hypothetical protein
MSLHIYPTWSPDHVLVYTATWWRRMNRDDVFASLDLLRAAYTNVIVHLDPK